MKTVFSGRLGNAAESVGGAVGFLGFLLAVPKESNSRIRPQISVFQGHADAWMVPELVANYSAKDEEAVANRETKRAVANSSRCS